MKSHYLLIALAGLPLIACNSHRQSAKTADKAPVIVERRIGSEAISPRATVFRLDGDYADHVAVTLDSDGNLLYYPAPSDITPQSVPISLGNGWWLNRQGIGPTSVFTKWTFAEYAALPSTPSHEEIKSQLIPASKVLDFKTLPIEASEAAANPEVCLQYLRGE